MTIDHHRVLGTAKAYTAARNTGSPAAVAAFFAEEGGIVINNGEPWQGHKRVAEMAAGSFADVLDMHLVCDQVRCAGDRIAYCLVPAFGGGDLR